MKGRLQGYSIQARWAVTGLMVWLVLVAAIVLASEQWKYRRGSKVLLPIAGGAELRVEVWPLVVLADRFSPYGYSMFSSDNTNARWVAVWYENRRTGTTTRLAAFTLPTWPPLAMAGTAMLAAGWTWRDQRRGRAAHGHAPT